MTCSSTRARSSGPAWTSSSRLPPAKKLDLALVMMTPVSESRSLTSRAVTAAIERR
jgi:hypothetical protein